MDQRRRSQKGQAIVLIALMMAVLIGFVALAIDSARAFDGRRILQDSVDAAALAAAESYQNGATWSAAQTNALQLFERDNRLYAGESCAPGIFGTPTPGQLGSAAAVTTTCTMSGGSGYVLTLSATDSGPAGQTFALTATRPLSIALMQVLGQASVTLTASSAATADDAALAPALAGLSHAGCFGNTGTTPLDIASGTNYLTVIGDVVSNGAAAIQPSSYLHVGGDVLTRCGPPSNADHITYQSGTGNVQGQLRNTAYNFADPGYQPPPISGLVTQGAPGNDVVLSPGIYSNDPQVGNVCYFLSGGVYEWQGGLTINGGLVSNELRPPADGTDQFWDDHVATGAHCAGGFDLKGIAGPNPVSGSYSVVITSVRTDSYNGTPVIRESAPSICKAITVSNSVIELVISNVPGATSYNVYAANNGNCNGTFGLVTMPGSNTNVTGPVRNNALACPDTNYPPTGGCSLGQVRVVYDGTAADTGPAPPDPLSASFGINLPGQTPPRSATLGRGDLANENHCAISGVTVACPLPGSRLIPANLVTGGAVGMYLTNGGCLNLRSGGDAFLFSGYQYNWLLNYEPLATTCSNTWQGRLNSALIGMSYAPGASFTLVGANMSQTTSYGGVVAASILVQNASGLTLYFNPLYSPRPPGTRLTA